MTNKQIPLNIDDSVVKSNDICSDIYILSPRDVLDTLNAVSFDVQTIVLDPWYNKGYGGVRDDYHDWLNVVINKSASIAKHIFVWGFPEIVAGVMNYIPKDYKLVAWLTWYYKNCPSVIRGWRPSQNACLHIAHKESKIYPEHFLNDKQRIRKETGKMRFIPGPPTVIEAPLLVGFVGKNEKTEHPSQKPIATIRPLILMSSKENDIILDPMCGSGTTGMVCKQLNRKCLLSDNENEYINITENRLGISRIDCITDDIFQSR